MTKLRGLISSEAGFTLIELLIVIAVLGILAGIAIPRMTGVINKAEDAKIQSAAGTIRSAMEMYYTENGKYPSSDDVSSYSDLDGQLTTVDLPSLDQRDGSTSLIKTFSYTVDDAGNPQTYTLQITSAASSITYVITKSGITTSS